MEQTTHTQKIFSCQILKNTFNAEHSASFLKITSTGKQELRSIKKNNTLISEGQWIIPQLPLDLCWMLQQDFYLQKSKEIVTTLSLRFEKHCSKYLTALLKFLTEIVKLKTMIFIGIYNTYVNQID